MAAAGLCHCSSASIWSWLNSFEAYLCWVDWVISVVWLHCVAELSGIPNLITADMIKEGAAVIDVGINRVQDPVTGKNRLVGDVDFEGRARWRTWLFFCRRIIAQAFCNVFLFSVHIQAWDRRRASSLQYLEAWDQWPWRCSWRTLSKQLRMFCCIPQRGFAWRLRLNEPGTNSSNSDTFHPPQHYQPTIPFIFLLGATRQAPLAHGLERW